MYQNNNNVNGNGLMSQQNFGEQEFTIHDYLAILFRGRWIILSTFLVMMILVTFYTFTTPPTFESSTTIMIDGKQGMSESFFDMTGFSQQRTLINNQVEILKSRSLYQKVIQQLLASDKKDSLELLQGLGEEKTYLDVLTNLQESITVTPVRDTDLITIKVAAPTPFEAAYLAKMVSNVYQAMDRNFTHGEISQIVQFLEEQLARKEKDLKQSENALKNYMEKEKIASLGDEASQIVEQGADFESLYKESQINYLVTKKKVDYLKSLLGKSKDKLEAQIAQVSSPLVLKLREELAGIERNIAVYLSQGVGENDAQVKREKEKLKAIKARLTDEIRALIVGGLPPDDPLAQAQGLVMQILESETELTALQARSEGLHKVVKSYTNKLESLPDKNVQLARLERSRKVDENLYVMMREKYEESRITKAGQIGKVRIIDAPMEPVKPISPKKKLNLLVGMLFGLGLGVGIAFLREYMDRSVRRVEDVEQFGLSVLASIPKITASVVDKTVEHLNSLEKLNSLETLIGYTKDNLNLITHNNPKSPISEAYRTLRTNLQFSRVSEQLHSFLVTSSGPGEGKSTTIANLAIVMSQQGIKTILIDADLRKPVVHNIFERAKNRGLTNVLVGNMSLDDAIQSASIANLDILTCGVQPPNPAELLGSQDMKNLIKGLRLRYDLCLFDAPPLIAVTDAAVLSKELDGVLLVVKSGVTQRDALSRSVELLRNVNARILGSLLNGVSREISYGSYYDYQQYYYDDEQEEKKGNGRKKTGKNRSSTKVHIVDDQMIYNQTIK